MTVKMYSPLHNYVSVLTDEIALEGLDGITLEALWTRLAERQSFTCALDDNSKAYFWKIIRCVRDVEMHQLENPRPPLVIFNRYNFVDPELGIVLEPCDIPEDIYPHCPIEDTKKKVRGSCSTYYQRENVTRIARTLSYEEVMEKWNSRMVVVAKQDARNTALMGLNSNPHLELTIMQYCVLERIGRSRYMGEVTQGKVSLQIVVDDPKALFYHRKFLMKHKLVVKQVHHQKTGHQNCSGSLMHLPRFRVERKPKALFLTEKIIQILKTRKNYLAEYDEIRRELGLCNSLKKLFKTLEFQRYVRTDLSLPYRELYPSASVSEWKHKGNDREKRIRVIKLINPDMDVREIWTKDDDLEDEDETPAGVLDQKHLLLDRSILSQANAVVEKAGPEGLTQMQLGGNMGISKLQSRTLCRNLLRKGVVTPYMNDVGRQRVFRYVSKRYEKEGKMSLQFNREKNKMLELVGKRKSKKKSKSTNEIEEEAQQSELKRSREEETETVGPDAKKMKAESIETQHIEVLEMQPGPSVSSSEEPSTSVVQNIETKVMEVTMGVPGVRETQWMRYLQKQNYQASFIEELTKVNTNTKEIASPNITYRILRRANIIIEAVRAHRVIDDLTKLMKYIKEEEDKEGYHVKIDKKSLLRLLVKLSKDGQIKVIKIVLKGGTKEKMLSFVCEPDITTDHTIIQSAVEQAKMKFFILAKEKVAKMNSEENGNEKEDDKFLAESINKSMNELKQITTKESKMKPLEFVYDKRIGKKYGFSPKFVRMQFLHQFLFYLLYDYTGREDLDQEAAIRHFKENDNPINDEIVSELSHIYLEEVGWKMFIPPLPKHAGWPEGWTIMCDVLLRLPLCIFVKIVNVSFIIPDLEPYLAHPIRKCYLVRHLPTRLRNALFVARRYIFSIHEVVQRLCYIGLIQFGPQRLKEKDQVFLYLNRRTSLLDTTPSKPGYHQVSDDMKYTEHNYEFNNLGDVDKYWYEMWNFCIHTQLGGRMHVTGKDIVLEVLQNKQVMIDAIQPRQPLEAPVLDTGVVPGDKRGAAGLDSAFFSHLKRNWNWTNTTISVTNTVPTVKPKIEEQRKARLASLKPEPLNLGEIFQKPPKKITKSSTPYARKKPGTRKSEANKTVVKKARVAKARNIVRRIMPRKKKKFHKPYYDEVDMKALQLMSKLRVEWSLKEDNLLLLCKVASMYLCPNPRKQTVNFQMIRDILHEICSCSLNKTSRACQRRIMYMMKNPATAHSVALHLEDIRQDPKIVEQFKDTIKMLNILKTEDAEKLDKLAAEKLRLLVYALQQKFNPEPVDYNVLHKILPETLSKFRKQYDLVYPSPTLKRRGHFQDIKNVVDVYCAVVNAIIHSSLCCVSDKTSYTYQLFQIYQQYPDNLLRSVMAKIRGDQMVSLKKSYVRLQKKGNYLPVSSSPYQLSISYVNQLQTRYQYNIFYECYQMCKKLCAWYLAPTPAGLEVVLANGGMGAALIELFTKKQIIFSIEIPEQVIILDPRVSEKDETYARIVQRYRDILRSYKAGKDMATSSVLFKKPYLDLEEEQKSDTPSGSKDVDDDADYMDADIADSAEDQATNTNQQHAIARAATRIALYMMREELGDSMMSGEKQHAHDFFVVNSCKVFCKLLDSSRGVDQNNTNKINEIDSTNSSVLARNKETSGEVTGMETDSEVGVGMKQPLSKPIEIIEQSQNDKSMKTENNKCMKIVEQSQNDKSTETEQFANNKQMEIIEQSQNNKSMETEQSENNKHTEIAEQSQNNKSMETEQSENNKHTEIAEQSQNNKSMETEQSENNKHMEIAEQSQNNKSMETEKFENNKHMEIAEQSQNNKSMETEKFENNKHMEIAEQSQNNKSMETEQSENNKHMEIVEQSQNNKSFKVVESETEKSMEVHDIHGKSKDINKDGERTSQEETIVNSGETVSCRFKPAEAENNITCVPDNTGDIGLIMSEAVGQTSAVRDGGTDREIWEKEVAADSTSSSIETSLELEILDKDGRNVNQESPSGENRKTAAEPYIKVPQAVSNALLPLTAEQIGKVLQDVASHIFVSDLPVGEDDVCKFFYESGGCDADWQKAQDILELVKKRKEIGATMKELRRNFRNSNSVMSLATMLDVLTKSRVLYRTGVTTVHYVYHLFTKPWLVHSYKLLRLEREKIIPAPEAAVINMLEDEPADKQCEKTHERIRAWRRRKLIAATKEVEKAVQTLDLSQTEKIHIAIRPWVRVDGSLNRRVLDRLLGAVLGHTMYTPGGSLRAIGDRFCPALQPYQVRELIEILQKLGCVKLSLVRQSCKTTLFSKSSSIRIDPADGTEDENKICVDPQPDAVIRLGQFIGDKAYSRDFLSMNMDES